MPSIGSNSKPAYVYDAGTDTWIPIGPGEHTHEYIGKNVITTTGDIIYASAANTPARLGIGSTSQVLTVSGGVPVWSAVPSSTPTFVGASAYSTSGQTVGTAYTAINLQAEEYDTNGFHDNSTNNSRMTVPAGKAGYYLCNGNITWAGGGSTTKILNFKKNNGTGYGLVSLNAQSNGTRQNCIWIFYCNVGDYVELSAYSGEDKSADNSYFQFTYLGA